MKIDLKNIFGGYHSSLSRIINYQDNDHLILKNISLTVQPNETIAILGQNGAGKSTLAKAIIQTLPYIFGDILLDDITIYSRHNKSVGNIKMSTDMVINNGIGYFAQGGKIFPNLTVEENIKLSAIKLNNKSFNERLEYLNKYFEILSSNNRINSRKNLASHLSGGEKQQLALLMVLIKSPKILLLDEPSAGLSPANINNIFKLLMDIKKNENISMIIIEQNVSMALKLADFIYIMERGAMTVNKRKVTKNSSRQVEKIFFEQIK